MVRLIQRAWRWAARVGAPAAPRVIDGYWVAGLGPFAVPVDARELLHDGYGPIRRRGPEERADPARDVVPARLDEA